MVTADDDGYASIVMHPVDADELDPEEQAKLDESIQESIDQMKAGQLIDVDDALAELRAHR